MKRKPKELPFAPKKKPMKGEDRLGMWIESYPTAESKELMGEVMRLDELTAEIQELPESLQREIFVHLNHPDDLLLYCSLSKSFKAHCESSKLDAFWKQQLQKGTCENANVPQPLSEKLKQTFGSWFGVWVALCQTEFFMTQLMAIMSDVKIYLDVENTIAMMYLSPIVTLKKLLAEVPTQAGQLGVEGIRSVAFVKTFATFSFQIALDLAGQAEPKILEAKIPLYGPQRQQAWTDMISTFRLGLFVFEDIETTNEDVRKRFNILYKLNKKIQSRKSKDDFQQSFQQSKSDGEIFLNVAKTVNLFLKKQLAIKTLAKQLKQIQRMATVVGGPNIASVVLMKRGQQLYFKTTLAIDKQVALDKELIDEEEMEEFADIDYVPWIYESAIQSPEDVANVFKLGHVLFEKIETEDNVLRDRFNALYKK